MNDQISSDKVIPSNEPGESAGNLSENKGNLDNRNFQIEDEEYPNNPEQIDEGDATPKIQKKKES